MDEYFKKIAALRALFKSSERKVSRVEFDTFARELLKGQSAILSVSWIPRVRREDRTAHELAASRDGVVGYRIKSVAPDGNLATSPDRDEYYPVYYTTERQYSGTVYGLDLFDGGVREEALKRARDRNELAASKVIVLHSGTGDRRGFFVLLPVYTKSMSHETVEERRHNIAGFVQGVFQLNAMIETILSSLRTPLDLNIFAPDSGPNAFPIYEPLVVSGVDVAGIRTMLTLPMFKDDEAIGAISIFRMEVRPFSDKQIELVSNFAAQAVIAIENTRLLKELRQRTDDLSESLEQQTATSEVLRVISSSPGELEPVFNAMLENATRICAARFGNLLLYDGSMFRVAAMHGAPPEWAEMRRRDPVLRVGPTDPLVRVTTSAAATHCRHQRDAGLSRPRPGVC